MAWVIQNWQQLSQDVQGILVALLGVFMALHALLVLLENLFPKLKSADNFVSACVGFLDKWVHGSGAWDKPVEPKAKSPTVTIGTSNAVSKGFASLRFLLAVTALGAVCGLLGGCSTVTWGSPSFGTGPSVGLVEVDPSNAHPVQLAPGAGWQASLEEGHFSLANGAQFSLLDISALALGSVVAPTGGGPSGQLQIGVMLATMNEMFGLAALTTPYSAAGGGWSQGGPFNVLVGVVFNPITAGSVLFDKNAAGKPTYRGNLGNLW